MEFTDVPLWLWYCYTFLFGVIIGSFLNVFIIRFHTGKSLSGSSHCMSCATTLRWYELFPLVSYLALRGRCRSCGAYISRRYFLVELLMGVGATLSIYYTSDPILWPFMFVLTAVLVVTFVYDIDHMIIQHEFVYTLLALAMGYVGYEWWQGVYDVYDVVWSFGAGAGAFLFFYGLWWYSGGRWLGLGDAKLAFPLGILVGAGGVFSTIVLAFWIGTIISLGIIVWQRLRRRGQPHLRFLPTPLTMKSEVPFAPFLILGFVCVFFGGVEVTHWFVYVWY